MYLPVYIVLGCVAAAGVLWATGANDVANVIGTAVGSRALGMRDAVILAAIFELAGASLIGNAVSSTVGRDLVDSDEFNPRNYAIGMFSALWASVAWLLLATSYGLPVSCTHSIVGALLGFALVESGGEGVDSSILLETMASWFLSPILGAAVTWSLYFTLDRLVLRHDDRNERAQRAFSPLLSLFVALALVSAMAMGPPELRVDFKWYEWLLAVAVAFVAAFAVVLFLVEPWWAHRVDTKHAAVRVDPEAADSAGPPEAKEVAQRDGELATASGAPSPGPPAVFSRAELYFLPVLTVSAATIAFAHGGNDVANAVGPFVTLWRYGQDGDVGDGSGIWSINVAGGIGIVVGLYTYGYKVVNTIGSKIAVLSFSKAFAAQAGATVSSLLATAMGLPISTSIIVVACVTAIGCFDTGLSGVNTDVVRQIVLTIVVTLPSTALLCAMLYAVFEAMA